MSLPDLVIRGNRVALPETNSEVQLRQRGVVPPFRLVPASIHIQDGRIIAITSYDEVPSGCRRVDVPEDAITMAGLVDTHVHINEPGRTEWEGFVTATRAAAAGGVTTLVDMPLNSIPPTTTAEGLTTKLEAARGRCQVDVAFWGGVVPGNTRELAPLMSAGVVGFKCFLVPSGVDEFPNVTEQDLREAMPELSRLGAVLIVHAELPGPIDEAIDSASPEMDSRLYKSFLQLRPRPAENEAVALVIRLSEELGGRVHIVHHSSADALADLDQAKANGVKITAETCPHYLYFAAEDIPEGATQFKCCPPIRERSNREALWNALKNGTIDIVVSDHSPCPPEMKLPGSGNFLNAWGGISSLQLRLPVIWTEAERRGFSISSLIQWLCRGPAELVGLDRRKGSLAVGCDADIVIWKPDQEFRVEPAVIHHRHKLTPYAGEVLRGVVHSTFLRGKLIYRGGEFPTEPTGILLKPDVRDLGSEI